MRASQLFFPTLREVPAEAEMTSHKLLLRGGFIRRVGAGIYNYLPLGYRVIKKIENIVREEMDAQGAQEILMPGLVPAELYRETGRWDEDVLFKFKDRTDREYSIGFTHEEVVTDIVRRDVRSYRELPLNLYQIQSKGRDEPRPRGGVVRGREFIMLDAYSFDRTKEDCDLAYEKMWIAFSRILARCGLDAIVVEAESGAIGGKENEEYMVLADSGEDVVLHCPSCGYAANAERCEIGDRPAAKPSVEMRPLELIDTPNQRTIEEVTQFLGKKPEDLVKTLIYKAGNEVVAALVRGDRDLNEAKLARTLETKHVEMADAETIERVTGAAVGFAGPVGLDGVRIIADREIADMANFVVGGNKTDTHFVNVNLDRDIKVTTWADLRIASAGDPCPRCDGTLESLRAIEAAHIFKLGTIYSEAMGATFLDADGQEKPFVMGCYGIGVSRMLAAIPEVHNDADGIIWPISVAPFEVEILLLNPEDNDQCAVATLLYEELLGSGVDVLLDERDERPGVKFKDADLIGIPIQVVCGRLASEGKIEVRLRSEKDKQVIAIDEGTARVLELRRSLFQALEEKADVFCAGRRK
ncbi:MAG: proline--tRNA ligase [Armatimonadetes bacterium]|nr:proline--tRNA ligase [Armatimonadota bacterium]